MIGGERHVRQRGIALRQRGRVGVLGLFELCRRNQVRVRLRLVAVELLFGKHEAMFCGVELRSRAHKVVLQIGWVEQRHRLSRLDGIADTHSPLSDLAANAKRKRRGIARLHLRGQRLARDASVGANHTCNDRLGRGRHDLALMTCGKKDCAARHEDDGRPMRRPDDGR